MRNFTWDDAAPALLFLLTAALFWKLVAWIRRGEIRLYDDGGDVEIVVRAKQRAKFWVYVAIYAGMAGFFVWLFGDKWLALLGRF